MSEGYKVPFSIDTTDTFKGFDAIIAGSEKVETEVKSSTNEMSKAFTAASEGGDKLAKTLQNDTLQVKNLRDAAKQMGQDVANALSGKSSGNDLEAKVTKFKALIQSVNAQNAKLGFSVDDSGLKKFEQMLSAVGDDTKQFVAVIDFAKEQLSTLTPGTEEFEGLNQQIQLAEGFLEGLGTSIDEVNVKNKSLRSELTQIKDDLVRMQRAGLGGTEEFKAMQDRAAELEEQISNVSDSVRTLASNTKYLDAGVSALQGLAGGFAVAQGAAALFGSENENLEKVLVKVQGAMALLQGVQAVAAVLNKESAFSLAVLNAFRGRQVVVTTAETVAEVANTGSTVANTAATTAQAAATAEATVATNAFTLALLANPVALVVAAIVLAAAALYQYASAADEAADAQIRLNAELDINRKILDMDLGAIERVTEIQLARSKSRGAAESEGTKITINSLRDELKYRKEYGEEIERQTDRLELLRSKDGISEEKYLETAKTIAANRAANSEAILNVETKITVQGFNLQTQQQKEQEDRDKKAKAARDKRLAEAKKAAEEQKKINDQILKFTREYETAQVELMAEGLDKQKAQITNAAKVRIDALQNEIALSKKAEQIRAKAIAEINKVRDADIKKAEEEELKRRTELKLSAASVIADLEKEGLSRELDVLNISYEQKKRDINEQYKDEEETRIKLLDALYQNLNVQRGKILTEYNAKGVDQQEEAEVLGVNLAAEFAVKSTDVEELKQIEILKVQLKYAKIRAAAIVTDGTIEKDILKKNAELAVKTLSDALGDAELKQKTKGFDWFEAFGLGKLTDKQKEAIVDGVTKSYEALGQITDFVVGQYQRQIDKKQEVIDQFDEEIDNLEDRLEREKELQEEGFANNVSLVEAEMAAKKAAKEEEIKQQEDLQKKQAALQKAQLAADTAVQASNLITASSSLFKSFATIPFGLGVPLAIATITLMTGAFIASKIKAFQAINDGAKFGDGGEIDGASHDHGGVKYHAADGRNIELEGGEYVIKRKVAQNPKIRPMIEALNHGWTSHLQDAYLQSFLEGTGISFNTDAPEKGMDNVRQFEALQVDVNPYGLPYLSNIADNVAYMAKTQRDRTERWEDDNYYYEMKWGVKTRRRKEKEKTNT